MTTRISPRIMTIAYLVRCYAVEREWNVTLQELADAVAKYMDDKTVSVPVIRGICRARHKDGKTWLDMLRSNSSSAFQQIDSQAL